MRRRLTYANVMATIAVFIALGGTGYAVTKLPRNSVGPEQLRTGAVTATKLAPDALVAGPRGPRGAVGPHGTDGARGLDGPRGADGARGPAGIVDMLVRRHDDAVNVGLGAGATVDVATFTLPVGSWYVQAIVNAINFNNGSIFRCAVHVDGVVQGFNQAVMVGNGAGSAVGAILAPAAAVVASSARTIVIRCSHDSAISASSDLPRFERIKVTAIRADNLDVKDV